MKDFQVKNAHDLCQMCISIYLVVCRLTNLGLNIISPWGEPDWAIFCKSILASISPISKLAA